MEYFLFRKTF